MKTLLAFALLATALSGLVAQPKTIHVYVALCDNEFQAIFPVPESLGNGKDPARNLYWGAGYGVKTFFKQKTTEWAFLKSIPSTNPIILEKLLFKHKSQNVYILAEAYDGEQIKTCIEDFLRATNGQHPLIVTHDTLSLSFGGGADLLTFIGHDGLMDFSVDLTYFPIQQPPKDVIVLSCYSKRVFGPEIRKAQANPLLWTTHAMAPEAYSLKSALDGWILQETGTEIEERAAQAYHTYQKCGIIGARNLFATGF